MQLDGAETLEMGRAALRVEWTPGHSPGHICLYDRPSQGFCSPATTCCPSCRPTSACTRRARRIRCTSTSTACKRLAAYEPQLILPAHGRPFTDAAGRVEVLVAHHRAPAGADRGRSWSRGEQTGWEVALELWGPRDNLYEKRLALQEGLAHLQALAVDGTLEKLVTPESVRWRRVRALEAPLREPLMPSGRRSAG